MAIERIVNTSQAADDDQHEEEYENSLRPRDFASYIGQERLKQNLKLAIDAAKKRGEPLDHVLLYGPPGLGKTTMASVIANEMGAQIRITSGPAIDRAGDLASLLTNLQDGDILFIDEIHRLNRSVEEVLYSAMEDFKLDIMLGKGPSARSLRLDLPKFTLIGATTRTGALAAPLRDRFGMLHRHEFYTPDEIQQIIQRTADILQVRIEPAAARELASRARLTPRIANRLLKRVRDYAEVHGDGMVDTATNRKALALLEIDELGLDPADRMLLLAIIDNYRGGPVGVETLAALTAEERTTIEDFYEPYLMQIGMLERTPRGRKVTRKTYQHLGRVYPEISAAHLLYYKIMNPDPNYQQPNQAKLHEMVVLQPGERIICDIKRHPFGLISMYVAAFFALLVVGVLAYAAPKIFSQNAPSVISNLSSFLVIGAVIFTVLICLILLVATIVYGQNRWIVTDDSITQVTQDSLFGRRVSQLSMENLEDVTIDQHGIIQTMFNFGTLRAETAGERSKFTFPYCPDPKKYARSILEVHENFIHQIRHQPQPVYPAQPIAGGASSQPMQQYQAAPGTYQESADPTLSQQQPGYPPYPSPPEPAQTQQQTQAYYAPQYPQQAMPDQSQYADQYTQFPQSQQPMSPPGPAQFGQGDPSQPNSTLPPPLQ